MGKRERVDSAFRPVYYSPAVSPPPGKWSVRENEVRRREGSVVVVFVLRHGSHVEQHED